MWLKSKFLVALLVAVIFCGNPIRIFASNSSLENLLNVGQYKNPEEFSHAVDSYFDQGGDLDSLKTFVQEHWSVYNYPDRINLDYRSLPRAILENVVCRKNAYEAKANVGNQNTNIGQILFTNCLGFIKKYKARLIFNDQNFSARDIPFQFQYFDEKTWGSGNQVSMALESIMKKNGKLEDVQKALEDAGAVKNTGNLNQKGFLYTYNPSYRKLSKSSSLWRVSIWLDDQGKFINISTNIPNVTVP